MMNSLNIEKMLYRLHFFGEKKNKNILKEFFFIYMLQK